MRHFHGNNVIEHHQIDFEKLNATVIALAIRLAFLGLLLFLSLSIIRPFIETVAWSVVWAVALYPVFDLVARWLGGRRRLAAALITLLLLLIVFGPVTWLGRDLLEVPRTISESLETGSISIPPPIEAVKTWPLIGEPLFQFWELASSNLKAALVTVAPYLKPLGSTLLGAAGSVGAAISRIPCFSDHRRISVFAWSFAGRGCFLVLHRRVSNRGDEFMQLAGATDTKRVARRDRRFTPASSSCRHRIYSGRRARREPELRSLFSSWGLFKLARR